MAHIPRAKGPEPRLPATDPAEPKGATRHRSAPVPERSHEPPAEFPESTDDGLRGCPRAGRFGGRLQAAKLPAGGLTPHAFPARPPELCRVGFHRGR